MNTFLGNFVLEESPNYVEDLTNVYGRKMMELDNNTGVPVIYDVSGFNTFKFTWFARGRAEHWRLRELFYSLMGRRVPIWVPTGMADFEMVEFLGDADTTMRVKRCGFTDMGGPGNHREHIVILLYDGTRLYRRITGAAIVGDGSMEQLALDAGPGRALHPADVKRISFLIFCRLDQDSVEFLHHTDTKGMMTVNSVFRTDPGIGSVDSFTKVEVDPDPPGPPAPLVIIDPFRLPSGKVWAYAPSFGTFAGSDWITIWWGARRSDADLIALDNNRLPADVGDAFSTLVTPPTIPTSITVPDTGSFLVRAGLYFSQNGWTTTAIHVRIFFENSTLEPVELTASGAVVIEQLATRVQLQSGRDQVYYAKVDPDLPLVVHVDFKFDGTGNLFPVANATNDSDPYHGKAGAVPGDSYFIVEWWPD